MLENKNLMTKEFLLTYYYRTRMKVQIWLILLVGLVADTASKRANRKHQVGDILGAATNIIHSALTSGNSYKAKVILLKFLPVFIVYNKFLKLIDMFVF